MTVFHSVHFEEIPLEIMRTSITEAIDDLNLFEKPPTMSEFASIWNTEVSTLCKSGKRFERKDKSLRSIVLTLFHDRRGKIAAVARQAWRTIFTPPATTNAEKLAYPANLTGVHCLSSSTLDCWGMIHELKDGDTVFRVVKRSFDIIPCPTESSTTRDEPTVLTGSSVDESTCMPSLLSSESEVVPVVEPSGLSAPRAVRMISPPTKPGKWWSVFIVPISEENYVKNYLGNTTIHADSTGGPPFGDVEWTIHPGCLQVFHSVMTSSCMSHRKVNGLVVDVDYDRKSKRVVSVSTNASPKLETFILSIVSCYTCIVCDVI